MVPYPVVPLQAAEGAVVLLFLVVGIGVPLVLYALVQREREATERLDRTRAERAARRDDDESQ